MIRPSVAATFPWVRFLVAVAIALAGSFVAVSAQIPGPNVNMVSGQGWPDGDPFLQRQNEPSVAVSTRNPLHLLAGANDYRTVDLPGLPAGEVNGDAWLGVFKSFDGGTTWSSTLLPGYPQDAGTSPIKGFAAAADPMVRSGSNGLFYYSGIAFNRTDPTPSALFVARYIDNNNKEHGDPIAFAGLRVVASNTGTAFIDKPALAVDIPRGNATCQIQTPGAVAGSTLTQTVSAGAVYVAYTIGTGHEDELDFESQIFFTASANCGVTWTKPIQLSSATDRINQGATIAISPADGAVHVAWRRFSADALDDGIVVTRSHDFGRRFTAVEHVRRFPRGTRRRVRDPKFKTPIDITELAPLDQSTFADQFRTNAYPTMTVDGNGRVYVAWAERGFAPAAPDPGTGDTRVLMSASARGSSVWTSPQPVDNPVARGHQIMPALAFAGGRLMLVWYDLRDDISRVFRAGIIDFKGIGLRHTMDLRAAQGTPGTVPVFTPSVKVSQYISQQPQDASRAAIQLQWNPPNLPLFLHGTAPFIGDYIDLGALPMVPTARGGWAFNTAASAAPVFHAAWTDNRDVHPPEDGDWTKYTPPNSAFHLGGASLFDPSTVSPTCEPGRAGMRNQNIYGARITAGLLVAAPGNAKPLSTSLQRAFVIAAQNTTDVLKTFRLTILNQPVGGRASFSQFPLPPFTRTSPAPLRTVDVQIAPRSSISRSIFVTSTDPKAQVSVSVVEITALGGSVLTAGLRDTVILNPDVSNPDVSNPDVSNPDVSNLNILNVEVFVPDVSNPDVSNPDVSNPDVSNPDVSNPDVSNILVLNPDVSNPDVSNPDVSNPDVSNPDVSNPDVSNAVIRNPDVSNSALTDVSWTITNNGNTTAAFSVKLVLNQTTIPTGIIKQLILYRQYKTPVADRCSLKLSTQNALIANIPNPVFTAAGDVASTDPTNGAVTNATLWLAPGESARITIRVYDPNKTDGITFDPVTAVVPVLVPHAVDSPKTDVGGTTPNVGLPPNTALPLTVINTADAGPGSLRQAMLNANTLVGAHILFNIPTTDANYSAIPVPHYTIKPQTNLPTMTRAVWVDGSSQPGYAGSPVVQLDGSSIATGVPLGPTGLRLAGGSSVVRGLAIGGFHGPTSTDNNSGMGIVLETLGSNQIVGNYIGTDYTGAAALPNNVGIFESGGGNTIGGSTAQDRNVLSGNTASGMTSSGNGNLVIGNYIGTDSNGTLALANYIGLSMQGSNNTIGRATAAERNVLVNSFSVSLRGGSGTQVLGNYIGTGKTGATFVGSPGDLGVVVDDSSGNTIRGNVIAGERIGVLVKSSGAFGCGCGNTVDGNYIGTNATGTATLPGGLNQFGIVLNAPSNVVGGGASGARNVVAGFGVGIQIQTQSVVGAPSATGNLVQGNLIGTNATGTAPLGNGQGIVVDNAPNNTIGGTTALARNVVSGSSLVGINIQNGASGNQVIGNYIGTDVGGTLAMGNTTGVAIGSEGNTIGGATAAERNIISASLNGNVLLSIAGRNNQILGNYIGTNSTGTSFVGAAADYAGVYVQGGTDNVIGRNVIAGLNHGVLISNSGSGNQLQGNYIGINSAGTATLPGGTNAFGVLLLDSPSNTVGGATAATRNVISGFNLGVTASGVASTGNQIQGNYIGTDASGMLALGNAYAGVDLSNAPSNTVSGNVISGNGTHGVLLDGASATFNFVYGNLVGTDATGAGPVRNTYGVTINGGSNNSIGSPIFGGNTIAYNDAGVWVVSGVNNPILSNAIFSNTRIGIDLGGSGVTPNDSAGHAGANNMQNFPTLTSATTAGVSGTLTSAPNTGYYIQYFSNAACDASGYGEGRTLLGISGVMTDGAGNVWVGLAAPLTAGQQVTATATDMSGNTSEFSQCAAVTAPVSSLAFTAQPSSGTAGQAIAPAIEVTALDATAAAVPGVQVEMEVGPGFLGTVPAGSYQSGLAIDPVRRRGYVSNNQENTVSVFDLDTGASIATVPTSPRPSGIVVDPVTNLIYVANSEFAFRVSVIDGNSLSVVQEVLGGLPRAVALDLGLHHLYVGHSGGAVTVLDTAAALTQVGTFDVGGTATGIAVDQQTHRVYVQRGNGILTVVDGTDNTYAVLASVPSALQGSVAINETTKRVYVTDGGGGGCDCRNIVMIDGVTNTFMTSRAVAKGTNGVTVDPATNRVYVASYYDHVLMVLDGDTLDTKFVAQVDVPFATPTAVAFDSTSRRVFVESFFGGVISVFNVPSLAGTTTVTANGSGVASFANLSVPSGGSGYQLRASAGSQSALSSAFDIVGPQGTPVRLAFTGQPAGAVSGATMAPVTVAIRDGFGTLVNNSTLPVTLAFTPGLVCPGSCPGLTSGTTTKAAVGGIATFDDLVFSAGPDTGAATLDATSGALTPTTSLPFTVAGAAPVNPPVIPPVVSPIYVTTTADSGAGSLRAAIVQSNNSAGVDTILFNIPGPAPYVISVGSGLPAIIDPVVIDGTSQPGFAGSPIVTLDRIPGPPAGDGLSITAGGSTVRGLKIAHFFDGISLGGVGGNIIAGNRLESNAGHGVAVHDSSTANMIGGVTAADRNVIGGNGYGIGFWNGAANNVVVGNYIGVDSNGIDALSNLGNGVRILDSNGNTVGGTTAGERNIISGNISHGVQIEGTSTGNILRGNYVGPDATGLAAVIVNPLLLNPPIGGGGLGGVYITSAANTIGGTAVGAGNLVSGNDTGIIIHGASATGNVVQGNLIGTDITGASPLQNSVGGIRIDTGASNNTIGGVPGGRNSIAFNFGAGVIVSGAATIGNAVLWNSIGSNGGLGIDLDDNGITGNDAGDTDTGANTLQNFPVVNSAESSLGTVNVTLSSTPNTTYTVQVFSNSLCDASGNGEGRLLLATKSATTDGSGNVTFPVSATPLNVGEAVTATATDPSGNTSEFSACKTVTP